MPSNNFQAEIECIRRIALNNEYLASFINNYIIKHNNKVTSNLLTQGLTQQSVGEST